jgi:hypothetical protein
MKDPETGWVEADITVNGQKLTFAQSMTVRVALQTFAQTLEQVGDMMGQTGVNYWDRIEEINALLMRNQDGSNSSTS